VDHADEAVALGRGDHAERDTEIPGRRLHQRRALGERTAALGRLDHARGGLELDRTGEIEALALEVQRVSVQRPQIDVEIFGVEFVRSRYDRHDSPSRTSSIALPKCGTRAG